MDILHVMGDVFYGMVAWMAQPSSVYLIGFYVMVVLTLSYLVKTLISKIKLQRQHNQGRQEKEKKGIFTESHTIISKSFIERNTALSKRLWSPVIDSGVVCKWGGDDEQGEKREDAVGLCNNWKKKAAMVLKERVARSEYQTLVCAIRPDKTNKGELRSITSLCKSTMHMDGAYDPMTMVRKVTDKVYLDISKRSHGFLAKECCCFVCFKRFDPELLPGIQQFFLDGLFKDDDDDDDAAPTPTAYASVSFPACSEQCVNTMITSYQKVVGRPVHQLAEPKKDTETKDVAGPSNNDDDEEEEDAAKYMDTNPCPPRWIPSFVIRFFFETDPETGRILAYDYVHPEPTEEKEEEEEEEEKEEEEEIAEKGEEKEEEEKEEEEEEIAEKGKENDDEEEVEENPVAGVSDE